MASENRLIILFVLLVGVSACGQSYKYTRIGAEQDAVTPTAAGYALMGGGPDLDEAFRFLCEKAAGGDFLIVRAAGGDDYNPYVRQLCKTNSVSTLLIPSREAANDPRVAEIIRRAEAVFIAGGDQARYINWWQGTPVQEALNAHVAAEKPIGGTSAGLAVLGEYIYSAQGDAPDDPDLMSEQALADPYLPRVTLRRGFLKIGLLQNTLTDTHFAKRDRMGRSLAFLARIVEDAWSRSSREIAVDESSAVLLEPDGQARIIGKGLGAYFVRVSKLPDVCRPNTPLTFQDIAVHHARSGDTFDVRTWSGPGGISFVLSVHAGVINSTLPNNQIY